MDAYTREHRGDHGFVIGLLTGTLVGAGLAMWLAPRSASEIRQRVTDSAMNLGKDVRDEVADAVVRGAQEVERYAMAAKTDGVETRKHSPADRSAATRHSL